MNGIVIKLDPAKFSSDGKNIFHRLYFKLENGSWAHTDVVERFHNFRNWKPVIKSGIDTLVGGLKFRSGSETKIDADSSVHILQKPLLETNSQQEKLL